MKNPLLRPELASYIESLTSPEPLPLRLLREKTQKLPQGHKHCCPQVGHFLSLLIQLKQPKYVLELGTFTGYSTLWLHKNLPSDGRLITCDTQDIPLRQESFLGLTPSIEFWHVCGKEALQKATKDRLVFDLVFLDADKKNYPLYYEALIPLLSPQGILVIDNSLGFQNCHYPLCINDHTQALATLHETIQHDPRITSLFIPLSDGIHLIMKN